jgi:streptogramin lyase
LQVDPGGDLWIGVQDAIWRYQPRLERWTTHKLPDASQYGFNYNQPYDMLIDQDGDTWIIVQLCGGAHCYAASYLYRVHQGIGSVVKESAPWDGKPQQLLSGVDGRSWLLWEGVFYQILEGDLVPVVALEARGLVTDPTGRVWALIGKDKQAALWVLDTALEE